MGERVIMDITIIGLGPGDSSLLTVEAREILEDSTEVHLRTRHHPVVSSLPAHLTLHSFDYLYEREEDFSAVYEEIARQVLTVGRRPEGVIYAVPGHPLVGEESVRRILALSKEEHLKVRIVVGLSFIEATLVSLEIDPLEGLQMVDATVLATRLHPNLDPDLPALIGQLYNRRVAAEVKLTLMNLYPADHPVTLVHRAATAEARIETLPLHELDHLRDIDHLTSLYLPPLLNPSSVSTFHDIVARLRAPGGCPWDRQQTHQTLRPHLLEETYEVLEALDRDDEVALQEELGDLLLQIILHTQIAAEAGEFTLAQVLETIIAKIVRRHPHVFADLQVADADEVLRNWEAIKRAEKPEEDKPLWGMPITMPALTLAQRAQERAKREGIALPEREVLLAEIDDSLKRLKKARDQDEATEELGQLLFALASLGHQLGVDAESALRTATIDFGEYLASMGSGTGRSDHQSHSSQ
jgi:tetrapyrrole methylase family protein/MazG family protein